MTSICLSVENETSKMYKQL